jgi:hypothetical protein|tara:strand:- start:537 stop:785 length:249 start_codon:yes stop_codon:yes gene_type:complete
MFIFISAQNKEINVLQDFMGKTHELLSKVLLEHGRLSLRQLVELVSFNLRQREMKELFLFVSVVLYRLLIVSNCRTSDLFQM